MSVQHVTVNNFLVNGFHFNDPTLAGADAEVVASDLHTIRTSGNIPTGSVSVLMDTNGSDNQLSDSVFTQSHIRIDVKSSGEFFSSLLKKVFRGGRRATLIQKPSLKRMKDSRRGHF